MADLHHLRAGEGKRWSPRCWTVRSGGVGAEDGGDLFRRYAPEAGSGDDAGHQAQIIFLDEPTTGLDPRSRRTMWNIVRELVADGVTVFLTAQNLEEADQLADRIAVLDQGHLVAEGTPGELKRQVPGNHVRLRFTDAREPDAAARVRPAPRGTTRT